MSGLELIQAASALPEKVVTNDDLSKLVDTSDEWIKSRTGIRERRFCENGEDTDTLAIKAAKLVLKKSGITPDKLSLVIVATCTPSFAMPSTACKVAEALQVPSGVPAFDVNAACSGFLYALKAAEGIMEETPDNYALIIGAEHFSKLLDMTDRSTCVLFGDGAGACLFKKSEKGYCHIASEGNSRVLTTEGGYVHMDGHAIFRFAVKKIGEELALIKEKTGIFPCDADYIVCHQANEKILDFAAKEQGISTGKFFKDLDKYGNTSAASIPIALADMEEKGLIKSGMKLILTGFGAGLTWGSALITVGDTDSDKKKEIL